MNEPSEDNIIGQLKKLLTETIDYLNSFLTLQQARFTALTLSSLLFIIQISLACVLGGAAFILFNIAVGIGLNRLLNNVFLTLSLLGLVYAILAWALSWKALRWLKNLKS